MSDALERPIADTDVFVLVPGAGMDLVPGVKNAPPSCSVEDGERYG